MIKVTVSEIKTKKKKKLYTVAIISSIKMGGKIKKQFSYQGRYKTRKAANIKKTELDSLIKDKAGV